MKNYRYSAECLRCGYKEIIQHDCKDEYREINVCPKCQGALIDAYKIAKYKQIHAPIKEESKPYKKAGITNVKNDLNFNGSGQHKVTIEILFIQNGFGKILNAQNEIVNDIHELLTRPSEEVTKEGEQG